MYVCMMYVCMYVCNVCMYFCIYIIYMCMYMYYKIYYVLYIMKSQTLSILSAVLKSLLV